MMTIMVPDLLASTPEMEGLCICIAQDLNQVCTLMKLMTAGYDLGQRRRVCR